VFVGFEESDVGGQKPEVSRIADFRPLFSDIWFIEFFGFERSEVRGQTSEIRKGLPRPHAGLCKQSAMIAESDLLKQISPRLGSLCLFQRSSWPIAIFSYNIQVFSRVQPHRRPPTSVLRHLGRVGLFGCSSPFGLSSSLCLLGF